VIKENGRALNLKEVWNERTGQVVRQARQKLKTAGRRTTQAYRQAQQKLKTAGRATTDYIEENPGKSVAISAGVGFILGLFFARSRRD